jgi:hypothetical protein
MSKDYSSPRGMNRYYVDHGKWSPDSQFFVYSLISSGDRPALPKLRYTWFTS